MKLFSLLQTGLVVLGLQAVALAASPEQTMDILGLKLPAASKAIANYVLSVRSGNLVFLAGQIPRDGTGKVIAGKVGRDCTEEVAIEAARTCALQLLTALRAEIGSLNKVRRIVRVGGFVNCTDDYTAQPKVINGASDLLVAVFGEKGKHARAAVGMNALPLGAVVEVEMIVEVE